MTAGELLVDAFERVRESVHEVLDGLSTDDVVVRVDGSANSIAWLVWHLTRVQDDHLAAAVGSEQVWLSGGWAARFNLPLTPGDTGYGHRPEDVGAVRVGSVDLLLGYHDAVCAQTVAAVRTLTEADLARVVDTRFTPPVTMAVRLISVISDDLQHVGQAGFVRGILERRSGG